MRSGNGRHRRPRQAPALLVTAGVTTAGIALPLLGATGAQAAGADTWDRVADCASGGVWSADRGDDAAGGLAISLEDWVRYGGEVYASSPDLASRSQQIAVAERILVERGPEAWGECATSSGLAEDRETDPGVDPGVPLPSLGDLDPGGEGAQEPEDARESEGATEDPTTDPGSDAADDPSSAPSSDPSDEASPAPEEPKPTQSGEAGESGRETTGADTDPTQSVDPSAPEDADRGSPEGARDADGRESGTGDGVEEATGDDAQRQDEGTGRHRGPRDPQDAAAERELERQRLDERQREGDTADRSERPDRYEVRTGDSLSAIAERYDLPGGWPALHSSNETVVGDDPDLILPGQLLDLDGAR